MHQMMKFLSGCAVLALAVCAASGAEAQTVTFDDLPGDTSFISDGYAGLNWSNFADFNASAYGYGDTGYGHGTISAPVVAYNAFGAPATISAIGSDGFTLGSAYFTAAWGDQTTYVNGVTTGGDLLSTSFTTTTTSPYLAVFNWDHVASVTFSTSYAQFAMDNLTLGHVSSSAPEPASWALMLGGFGAIGGAMRARRKTAVTYA
jgi:hypothetical protein